MKGLIDVRVSGLGKEGARNTKYLRAQSQSKFLERQEVLQGRSRSKSRSRKKKRSKATHHAQNTERGVRCSVFGVRCSAREACRLACMQHVVQLYSRTHNSAVFFYFYEAIKQEVYLVKKRYTLYHYQQYQTLRRNIIVCSGF